MAYEWAITALHNRMPTDDAALCVYLPLLRQLRKEWTVDKYGSDTFAYSALMNIGHADVHDPQVTHWCVQGYAAKLLGITVPEAIFPHPVIRALHDIAMAQGYRSIAHVNNERGHAATCKMVDTLIARLEASLEKA